MYTTIIIDDEARARNLLQAVIEQYCPQLTVAALCEDLATGVKAIKKYKPSLVLLDIEMPGHSGLELLDFFNDDEINFSVIFTTAYNEYALQAFKFSAIDYLLKPIQHEQLVEAVERFVKRQDASTQVAQLRTLQSNLGNNTWQEKRIVVPSGQALKFYKPADIIMIKAEGAYSTLHLADGATLLASKNLKHFEDVLAEVPIFLRTHKSFIVNLNEVTEYVKSDGGYIKIKGGLTAGISPEKVDDFLERLR